MFLALFALYLVVEVAAVVWVASMIGVAWTIVLFAVCWAIGLALAFSQFRQAFGQFVQAGRGTGSVDRAIVDGALVAAASILLIVPGLVTGLLGLLLVLPPTRRLLRPVATLLGGKRLAVISATGMAGAGVYSRMRRRTVVDGTVVEDVIVETGPEPDTTRIVDPLAIEGEVVLPDPGAHRPEGGRAD